MQPTNPAGWFPDPQDPGRLRWWTGTAWSAQVADASPPPEVLGLNAPAPEQLARAHRHAAPPSGRGAMLWITAAAVFVLAGVVAVVLVLTGGSSAGPPSSPQDGAAQSDVRNAVTAVQQCVSDNDEALPTSVSGEDARVPLECGGTPEYIALSAGDSVVYVSDDTYYSISVTAPSGDVFTYRSTTGKITKG